MVALEYRVVRRFGSDTVIHSDIEVLDRAGKVYYRLENWETRRFPACKAPPASVLSEKYV